MARPAWSVEQRGVLRGVVCGLATTAAVAVLALALEPALGASARRARTGRLGASEPTARCAAAAAAGPPAAARGGACDGACRGRLAAKWAALPAACLLAAVARMGNHRFSCDADIAAAAGRGAPSARARVLQAQLQNTLEQAVLAAAAGAAWAAAAPASGRGLVLLPAHALLFVAGRALFTAGYESGAAARALGFSLTFQPSALMLAAALTGLARDPW
ncbi:hypothetical protein HT031_005124 [Scenedesmus sp. PABB004]|nr:hypothetical protein HT031_005124 [Scenedesmus sp. PABB004]